MHCPHCGKLIKDRVLISYTHSLAGQAGTGKSKARTHEHAVAAGKAGALARWGKPRKRPAKRKAPNGS
jgi:hypothetical protein